MEYLGNVFTNFIFEKLLSHEALVTGRVTATSNNQTQLFKYSSYKWQKLLERYTQLRLFPKQILCQSYFTFWIIFTNWIWFVNTFKCISDGNVWPPGQRAEIRERIASESLQKSRTKFYEVPEHVGRVKTVVTSHLRKMFRSHINKAAECNTTARINWDKLTETNSYYFHKPFATGTSNNLLTAI